MPKSKRRQKQQIPVQAAVAVIAEHVKGAVLASAENVEGAVKASAAKVEEGAVVWWKSPMAVPRRRIRKMPPWRKPNVVQMIPGVQYGQSLGFHSASRADVLQ